MQPREAAPQRRVAQVAHPDISRKAEDPRALQGDRHCNRCRVVDSGFRV